MNLDNFEIYWKQIKGEAKTQWVKLAEKGSGIVADIGHKSKESSSDSRGPTKDSTKEKDKDTKRH